MKKLLAVLLSVVIPALSFGAVQYHENGMFTFDKAGEVYLKVLPSGTTFGHVGEVGYFISIYGVDDQALIDDLTGSNQTLGPVLVTPEQTYGFYMTLTQGNTALDNYYSVAPTGGEADWFSYNTETNTASFTLLNGNSGNGMGHNTLTFLLSGSAVNASGDTTPSGAPLPGAMASIALCMGAFTAMKRVAKKK